MHLSGCLAMLLPGLWLASYVASLAMLVIE